MEKRNEIGKSVYFKFNMMKRVEDLYHFFFLMLVSHLLLINPIYGGAVYVTGLVWIGYSEIYFKRWGFLEAGGKVIAVVFPGITLAVSAYLVIIYPFLFNGEGIFIILAATAVVLLKPAVDRIVKPNIYRLLSYFMLIFLFMPFVVSATPPKVHLTVPAGLLIGSIITYAKNIYGERLKSIRREPVHEPAAKKINSYRLYANTVVFATAALQIMIMMYVSYMRYATEPDLVSNIFDTLLTVFLMIIILGAIISFLQKRVKFQHYEKTLIFVIAAAGWVIAGMNIYNAGFKAEGLGNYVNVMMIILGASFVFFILTVMRDDFKGVLRLADEKIKESAVESRMRLMDGQSVFIAYFTVMLMLASLCIDPRHQTAVIGNPGIFDQLVVFYMLVVPALFLIMGIIYSIRQPLTKKYSEKLKRFRESIARGRKNPHLEKQLITVLVKKYKTRFGIKVIAFLLYPIFRHKVEGKENVVEKDPAVFVCNHKEIYGPVVTHLYLPYICRPWIISGMVERKLIYDHLQNGYNVRNAKIPLFLKKIYCKAAGPVLIWAMNSVEPIPVYRESGRGVVETMKLTVEALEQEDNILLFPENNIKTGGYKELPGEFFTGFAHIGKEYLKKTGLDITFYPMYADSKKRIIFIGEGVKYDRNNHPAKEKERIAGYLKQKMDELAGKGAAE